MRTILLATDAWLPQVNGVVRTYQHLREELHALGVHLAVVGPGSFRTVPMPAYPEIKLAFCRSRDIAAAVGSTRAHAIHIATEGPIGWAARRWCLRNKKPFTACFHTRFPEYIAARLPVPASAGYAVLRRFHNRSAGTMAATPGLARDLKARGFTTIRPWTRGVDMEFYTPRPVRVFGEGRVLLYVGRVAVEKNIEAFLDLECPGRKVVVGYGPTLERLRMAYPEVTFTGGLDADALVDAYASSDVFVFPSRTDTFGIVMLEAMACGVPVAAYPVMGPVDVVVDGQTGVLDDDLGAAVARSLELDRNAVRRGIEHFSWSACARQFLGHIATTNGW